MPASERVVERLVAFGQALRAEGLEVGPGRVADALAGLAAAGIGDRERVYWTLRQTLVARADELETFDRAFETWFAERVSPPPAESGELPRRRPGQEDTDGGVAARPEPRGEGGEGGWSAEELLRRKDFAQMTDDELARLRRLVAQLAVARPRRRSRRLRPHPRGATLDLRRLVRASLATGGDPLERAFRRRTESPRRLIVLCDVSGSMERYSQAVLVFVHSLLRTGRGVEAFLFGTRLTRVTEELAGRDPDRAFAAAALRVVDWSGGTRIGASLRAFNDTWGRRALSRGAVVVIVSDGWEREDTAIVAREMARLARHAYALIWLNPLKGHPDYQPLAGGMRAALPYVDRFLPGHNFESLVDLAEVLAGIDARHAA